MKVSSDNHELLCMFNVILSTRKNQKIMRCFLVLLGWNFSDRDFIDITFKSLVTAWQFSQSKLQTILINRNQKLVGWRTLFSYTCIVQFLIKNDATNSNLRSYREKQNVKRIVPQYKKIGYWLDAACRWWQWPPFTILFWWFISLFMLQKCEVRRVR